MSYVAISGQLLRDVETKIDGMRIAEWLTIAPCDNKIDGSEPQLVALVWGQNLHLKDIIPPDWAVPMVSDSFIVHYGQPGEKKKDLAVTCDPPLAYPPDQSRHKTFVIGATFPGFAHIRARMAAEDEVSERWDKVKEQIMTFLKSAKSLNEAFKLWPQIEMYIPGEAMSRVREKKVVDKEPSKAMETLGQLDTDQLTAAAVIARISAGQNSE